MQIRFEYKTEMASSYLTYVRMRNCMAAEIKEREQGFRRNERSLRECKYRESQFNLRLTFTDTFAIKAVYVEILEIFFGKCSRQMIIDAERSIRSIRNREINF